MEESNISSILLPVAEKLGYRLVSVKYQLSKDGPTLNVVVDRDEPIGLDDIVALSDPLSKALDEADPIAGAYTLDISSLGAEKPIALDKLESYQGRYVNLHLSKGIKGENILEGELSQVTPTEVTLLRRIKGRPQSILIPRESIDKARLAIKF